MNIKSTNPRKKHVMYQEGKVRFLAPKITEIGPRKGVPSRRDVFYNPRMELNRDLSVCAIQWYSKQVNRDLIVCDAFTGCGVRSLRYKLEVENVDKIVANDINPSAADLAFKNVKMNNLEQWIKVTCKDANLILREEISVGSRFDVIDIDPFGTPSPFIESSIWAAKKKRGFVLLTATDMPPLCGIYPKVAFRKYGGLPIRTAYSHELAVRLLCSAVIMAASRLDIGVTIQLILSTDHYIRVFVETRSGATYASKSQELIGYLVHCPSCGWRKAFFDLEPITRDKCECCNSSIQIAGPLYLGSLFTKDVLTKVIAFAEASNIGTRNRLIKIMKLQLEEVDGPPTYINVHRLNHKVKAIPPLSEIIDSLHNQGYFASRTHFNPLSIRTDANPMVVKKIIKDKEK